MTDDTSAAPERLWLEYTEDSANIGTAWDKSFMWLPEYIRADLIPAMLQEARNEALREAAFVAKSHREPTASGEYWAGVNQGVSSIKNAILALLDTPAPTKPAGPAGDVLWADLLGDADWKRSIEDDLAAAQPALADREALVVAIGQTYEVNLSYEDASLIADALLARGLRLPSQPETLAWAVVGEENRILVDRIYPEKSHVWKSGFARVVPVAIRVLDDAEGGA